MASMSDEDKKGIKILCDEFHKYNHIDSKYYERYDVKRGLRNADGTGVVAGLTQICNVHGYVMDEGEKSAVDGQLFYRGINVKDIVNGCLKENRYGYEEVVWLLLFGRLPNKEQLSLLRNMISECRELPFGFAEDMMIKAPTPKTGKIVIPGASTKASTAKASGNVIADFTKTASGTDIQKAVTQAKRKALKAGNRTVYVEEGSPIDYFLKYGKLPSLK